MAVRVYQVAKRYAKTSEEIISILKEAGVDVSSHTSALDEHALHTIRAKMGGFKLSVVEDGDEDSAPAGDEEMGDAKAMRKAAKRAARTGKSGRVAKKEEEAAPLMKVRIIKKHDEPDHEEDHDDVEGDRDIETRPDGADSDQVDDPKPSLKTRPKLRRKTRTIKIEDKIHHKLAERNPEKPAAPQQSQSARTHGNEGGNFHPPKRHSHSAPPRRQPLPPPVDAGLDAGKPQVPKRAKERELNFTIGELADQPKPRRGRNKPGKPAPAATGRSRESGPNRNQPASKDSGPPAPPSPKALQKNKHMATKPSTKKKRRRRKDAEHLEKVRQISPQASKVDLPQEELGIIMLSEGVTVKELAEKVNRLAKDIIKRLIEKGMFATINDVLDKELAIELAKDFGYLAEIVSFEEDLQITEDAGIPDIDPEEATPRAPIVTILGHVDHGKTTLLDRIRSTKVAEGESGGITQHIGAYTVSCNDQDIVFLDTPGHEAFTKMRARGASVTDIAILVVAADDGVKPQTIEAINHAKAAKVPIIVCINKIDKPEANPDKVKTMLTEHDLIIEDFGGDAPCVLVSAKKGEGIQDLLEMILLVAEIHQYKANNARRGRGTVIEAKLDRGRGPVATVLVQDGVVKIGDFFITGNTYGKIRGMFDDMGNPVTEASSSTPVEILGIQTVPDAGDPFQIVEDEARARQIANFRQEKARDEQLRTKKVTSLDQLFSKIQQGDVKELAVILKADVHGSVEGIQFALDRIQSEKVKLRIIHTGVGNVTENDVLLAVASDATIIGFNVKSERKAQELASHEGVSVWMYSVIYEIVSDIEKAMLGLVDATIEERETAKIVVRQVFNIPKHGKIAGCFVESGVVKNGSIVKVLRNGDEIHKGEISNLKRFKDDVNEVKSGFECGLSIKGFNDIEENDVLVVFVLEEIQPTSL